MTHNANPTDENHVYPFTVSRNLMIKQYDEARKQKFPAPKREGRRKSSVFKRLSSKVERGKGGAGRERDNVVDNFADRREKQAESKALDSRPTSSTLAVLNM